MPTELILGIQGSIGNMSGGQPGVSVMLHDALVCRPSHCSRHSTQALPWPFTQDTTALCIVELSICHKYDVRGNYQSSGPCHDIVHMGRMVIGWKEYMSLSRKEQQNLDHSRLQDAESCVRDGWGCRRPCMKSFGVAVFDCQAGPHHDRSAVTNIPFTIKAVNSLQAFADKSSAQTGSYHGMLEISWWGCMPQQSSCEGEKVAVNHTTEQFAVLCTSRCNDPARSWQNADCCKIGIRRLICATVQPRAASAAKWSTGCSSVVPARWRRHHSYPSRWRRPPDSVQLAVEAARRGCTYIQNVSHVLQERLRSMHANQWTCTWPEGVRLQSSYGVIVALCRTLRADCDGRATVCEPVSGDLHSQCGASWASHKLCQLGVAFLILCSHNRRCGSVHVERQDILVTVLGHGKG